MKSLKPARKLDYKLQLLSEIAPSIGVDAFEAFKNDLYMIKAAGPGHPTDRILLRDGGWIEVDRSGKTGKTVRTWGPAGRAQVLAAALASKLGVEVEHLAKAASFGADSGALKVVKLSEDTIKDLASWWIARGYSATAAPDGAWVNVGRSRIHDTGSRLTVHGALTDEAIAATITKAKDAWSGGLSLHGSWTQHEQDRLWIAAQRAGVEIANCSPSKSIQESWRREQGRVIEQTRTISAARSAIADAADIRDAAGGDLEALNRLPKPLQAFVISHLDDEQRKHLSGQTVADITGALPRFRGLGADELAEYERQGRQFVAPKPHRRDHDRENENAYSR
ncbi:LPD7 domain-containing protein [Bradyrhizobium sp. SZCCHNPS2010]|uniref:LPD7 domain-containing protein n=1 Tax=Bradyrhizobium sp. SZCCHNPS2010 TaxID=3057333 RepID=UPI002916424B|nr:LPD7 domain-containing protein [Bradyrhizobium sp. SZCCHNPS2010]